MTMATPYGLYLSGSHLWNRSHSLQELYQLFWWRKTTQTQTLRGCINFILQTYFRVCESSLHKDIIFYTKWVWLYFNF